MVVMTTPATRPVEGDQSGVAHFTSPSPPVSQIATAKDTTMALISLHALMRHQNHRRMKTSPVPAPICRRIWKAWRAF